MKNASVTPAVTVTFDEFDDASALVLDQIQIDLDSIQGDVDRDLVDHVVASAIAQLEGELFSVDGIEESFDGSS
jgi:hypothetical protein